MKKHLMIYPTRIVKTNETDGITDKTNIKEKIIEINKEYVFINLQTNQPYKDIKRIVKSLFKEAKMKNFTLHCFRHTFATWAIMNGASVKDVQELLGHYSINTTQRYTHTSKLRLKMIVNNLRKAA